MRRRRCWPRADRLAIGCAAALLFAGVAGAADDATPGPSAIAPERLVLAVTLNGTAVDADPVLVERRGTVLAMRAADLAALGIAVRADAGIVTLDRVAGLGASVDAPGQTIHLTYLHRGRAAVPASAGEITPNGWGAALNYDVAVTQAAGRTTAGALVDAVVYGPRGYFFGGVAVAPGDGARATLLDTGFTTGDALSARRLTIGHAIAGATEQSRPVRLLGVQYATDFALRPDLVTTPLPDLGLGAAVPTAADVVVNGERQARSVAGSFAPADVAVRAGVNTVTTTVRDALGRETRRTLATYVAPPLLRPGLRAFSVEAGLVRRRYDGLGGYGPPAASGTWRRGLDDRLTVEAHGEVGERVALGGVGAARGLGTAGLVSGSAAIGRRGGVQWSLGYERIARPFSIAARYVASSAGWYDIAADNGTPVRRHAAIVTLGFDLAPVGNLGVAVIDQGAGMPGRDAPRYRLPPSRFVTATWSARIATRLSLVANAGIDTRRQRSGYASLGALLIAGSRRHGYVGGTTREGGTSIDARWRSTAVAPGDWGYGLAATTGTGTGVDRQAGELTYQGAQGRYTGEVERVGDRLAARVSARGALAIGAGLRGAGVMLADRLTGSFAVVDTGLPGVRVFRDRRPAGTSDRHGRLIVADLPALVATQLSLDPLQFGDDTMVGTIDRTVRPAMRAGVPVRFAVEPSRAATARLMLAPGLPVPAGARATLDGGAAVPVGMDGEVYLPALGPRNRLHVTHAGRTVCAVTFDAPAHWRPGGSIGELACRPTTLALTASAPIATRPPPH